MKRFLFLLALLASGTFALQAGNDFRIGMVDIDDGDGMHFGLATEGGMRLEAVMMEGDDGAVEISQFWVGYELTREMSETMNLVGSLNYYKMDVDISIPGFTGSENDSGFALRIGSNVMLGDSFQLDFAIEEYFSTDADFDTETIFGFSYAISETTSFFWESWSEQERDSMGFSFNL